MYKLFLKDILHNITFLFLLTLESKGQILYSINKVAEFNCAIKNKFK